VCENYTVKMDRCLRSRSASTAQDEDAASVTSDSATQDSTLSNEPGLNARNTETNIQEDVDLFNNSKVTSGRDEIPVLVHQLQSMFATFMTAKQAENAKLASNLESKLNKLSDNVDAKLASVSESLDTKLNMVSDRLDVKINSMITNATSEMRRKNNKMRQEFTIQPQTEVQLIAKEVEVVRNSTDTELTNCVQNFESEC